MLAKTLCVLLGLCISVFVVKGQAPELVEDIVPGPDIPSIHSTWPRAFTSFYDKLYFVANDSANIHCFYSWNQMGVKAKRIVQVNAQDAHDSRGIDAFSFPIFKSKLYYPILVPPGHFAGDYRLMVFDGINQPTVALSPTSSDSTYWGNYSWPIGVIGNNMYYYGGRFDSLNSSYGSIRPYLYNYDGTSKPTLITRACANYAATGYLNTTVVYNNKLYFIKDSTGYGKELFCYDPATNLVSLAADIVPGPKDGTILYMTTGGGLLWFDAWDPAHGRELYSYDGTTVKRRTDRMPGSGNGVDSSVRGGIAYFNGGVFFTGKDTPLKRYVIYRYDINADTVARICDPKGDTIANAPFQFCSAHYKLYFQALTTKKGTEIWSYEKGDSCYMNDFYPGPESGCSNGINMIFFRGYIFYCGNAASTGLELYRIKDTAGNNIAIGSQAVQSVMWDGEAILYPNPAKEQATLSITVASAQKLNVSLFDMSGKMVFSSGFRNVAVGKSDIILPLSVFATGTYYYKIADRDGRRMAGGVVSKE